ncbi:MAG: amidohydrolase family protein [Chloroflexi bacterium]|nr:amidohydrolase family protein [Chloroflexota bacterium]MBV9547091.1 amidohydrolase family protein [Chloroflexota bacterium]
MLNLLVQGGTVVGPGWVEVCDVGVQGERIVSLTRSDAQALEAEQVIDARGLLVVPGGIEPHAHLAHFINQRPEAEMYTLGPEEDTVGMAFGGVTTHIDFCQIQPGASVEEALQQRTGRWKGQSLIDYSFHINFLGASPIAAFEHVPELIQSGFPSFKVFTCNVLPPKPPRRSYKVDFGRIGHLMEKVAVAGGIMVVHAEDDDLVQFNYELFSERNRTGGTNLHLVHSKLSEELSFHRTIRLARARRAAVYFVHTSASEGVEAIQRARARDEPIYGETLHQYLCHTADEYAAPGGFRFHTYPSVKLRQDQDALWRGLLTGALSTVATDEFPTTREVKLMGSTIEDVTGGNLGAEARMGIVYTEGVSKRGMSPRRFVDVTSSNAARIFGLYPRKGVIAIGSDADLTLMDTRQSRRLTRADFHVADYSPWENWEVTAWPTTTILRGQPIVHAGQLLGKPGYGQLLPRKIDPELLQRPVL